MLENVEPQNKMDCRITGSSVLKEEKRTLLDTIQKIKGNRIGYVIIGKGLLINCC